MLVMKSVLSIILLLTASVASGNEIYRWVDENGVVNYTQQKPRDVEVEKISAYAGTPTTVRTEAILPSPDAQPSKLDDAQQAMLDELKAAEQIRKGEVAKIREENCQRSRDVLNKLTLKERVRVRGDDGTQRVMGESERQRRINEAQMGIATNCISA